MLATIRADFYRLFKSKGFWISQFISVAFIVLSIASKTVGTIGVGNEDIVEQFESIWTGVVSVQVITSMMGLFFYAMLPMMVIIIGHDFSKETYKNILTVGISRTKYFLSQYCSLALMILLQVVFIYLVSFGTGSVFYGAGDSFSGQIVKDWIWTGLIQYLMIMAIFTVSCLVTFITKNNIAAVLTAIIFPLVINIISFSFRNVEWMSLFDFEGIMGNLNFILSGSKEVMQSIYVAIVSIIAIIGITIWQFNKSEL